MIPRILKKCPLLRLRNAPVRPVRQPGILSAKPQGWASRGAATPTDVVEALGGPRGAGRWSAHPNGSAKRHKPSLIAGWIASIRFSGAPEASRTFNDPTPGERGRRTEPAPP